MSVIWANGMEDNRIRATATSNASVSTTDPRTGTRKLNCTQGGVFSSTYIYIDHAAITTGWVYCAFKNNQPQWQAAHPLVSLVADAGATGHTYLWFRQDGRFELRLGATVLATGTYVVRAGEWIQLAIKIVIADAPNGRYELRINGSTTPDINFSGDTRNGGSANWTRTYFGSWDTSQFTVLSFDFDDLIIQDNAGSSPENDWLGDLQIDAAIADGDGDDTAWAIGGSSPAATRWQSIDELVADDAVTLVESNTVGQRNLFTFAAVPTTQTVAIFVAAMITARMIKASATARGVKQAFKSGGTLGLGAEHTLTTSYADYAHIAHDDPGGSAWTNTTFNGAQGGVEVTT